MSSLNNNTIHVSDDPKSKILTNTTTTVIQRHSSSMTPSIITTINNTSPSPQHFDISNQNNIGQQSANNSSNSNRKKHRPIPQPFYESYIEDSFVGHWEHEDDDLVEDDNQQDMPVDDDSNSILHSSTIEFDFDSFGPESIVYAPNGPVGPNVNKQPQIDINDDTTSGDKLKEPHSILSNEPGINGPISVDKIDENKVNHLSIRDDVNNESHGMKTERTISDDILAKSQEDITNETKTKETITKAALLSQPIHSPVDEAQIDLKVIEPYRKVISHAGYCHFMDPANPTLKPDTSEPAPAVIVFSACYLPDRSRRDYDYVMDHLFLYVLSSLHELIADDYILIFFHNTQPSTATKTSINTPSSSQQSNANNNQSVGSNNLPSFTWIKRCYQLIGRKLRKNLRVLYLVKPTFWLKTIVIMCKPFISSKFSRKIQFIENMEGLKKCLPVDKLILPASADNL